MGCPHVGSSPTVPAGVDLDKYTTDQLYISSVIKENEDRADALFHAFADRTRRDIMRRVLAWSPPEVRRGRPSRTSRRPAAPWVVT